MGSGKNSLFFFMSGVTSLHAWNSILNLNGYFENRYHDPKISKYYSLLNMLFGNIAIFVSYFLSTRFNTLSVSKITFILIYVFFHLIYLGSELIPSKQLFFSL